MSKIIAIVSIIGVFINTLSFFIEKHKNEKIIWKLENEVNQHKRKIEQLEKKIEDSNSVIEYYESQLNKLRFEKSNHVDDQSLSDLIEYNYDFL